MNYKKIKLDNINIVFWKIEELKFLLEFKRTNILAN